MNLSARSIAQARRAVSASLVLFAVALASSPFVYLLWFDRFPPTRLNLLFWIPSSGEDCIRQALRPEGIPLFGTGIRLGDICPESQYGPGIYDSILVGPWLWVALLVVGVLTVAQLVWASPGDE